MKKISIALFLMMPFWLFAQQQWQPVNSANPAECIITDLGTTISKTTFTVSTTGFFRENIVVHGTSFQRLELLGGGKTTQEGYPEIPYIKALVAIPECMTVVVNVIPGQTETYSNYMVYPAPAIHEVTKGETTDYIEVFSIDTRAYTLLGDNV